MLAHEPQPLSILDLGSALTSWSKAEREGRVVSVFKVCIDESGDPLKNKFYVVAGGIGTLSSWRKFYPLWRKRLAEEPAIPHFHMSSAYQPNDKKGIFYGWKQPVIDKKVARMAPVTGKCAIVPVVAMLELDSFRDVMRRTVLPEGWDDPYFMAFAGVLVIIADHMSAMRGKQKKPLIVFDSLTDKEKERRARSIFDELKNSPRSELAYKRVGRWLGSLEFLDDKEEEIGLQAADLIAWQYRTAAWEATKGKKMRKEVWMCGRKVRSYFWSDRHCDNWKWSLKRHLKLMPGGFFDPDPIKKDDR